MGQPPFILAHSRSSTGVEARARTGSKTAPIRTRVIWRVTDTRGAAREPGAAHEARGAPACPRHPKSIVQCHARTRQLGLRRLPLRLRLWLRLGENPGGLLDIGEEFRELLNLANLDHFVLRSRAARCKLDLKQARHVLVQPPLRGSDDSVAEYRESSTIRSRRQQAIAMRSTCVRPWPGDGGLPLGPCSHHLPDQSRRTSHPVWLHPEPVRSDRRARESHMSQSAGCPHPPRQGMGRRRRAEFLANRFPAASRVNTGRGQCGS